MAASMFNDLKAVRLVWSRRLNAQLAYWLVIIGYDRETGSFSSRIYLVYVIIFFSLWIFVVLTLFAGFAGQILTQLSRRSPALAAAAAGAAGLVAYTLLELTLATRRSPFSFSEEDAHLLCMTPVDRRIVALIWLVDGWLKRGLILWPVSVVLGYALVEANSAGELSAADLPRYLLAGLRMVVIAILMLLGGQSLAWAAGARRLRGVREITGLRWLAPVLGVVIFGGWLLAAPPSGGSLPVWLGPVSIPIRAGLGVISFPAGLGIALAWGLIGALMLWYATPDMSLARASQETRGQQALQQAILTGSMDLAQEIRQREKLGSGREPSRLPAVGGPWVLMWKNALQGMRRMGLGSALPWLGIFGLSLGAFAIPQTGARGLMLILWIYFGGQRAAAALRNNLQRWWLLRQMPQASEKLAAASIAAPFVGLTLAGLAAMLTAALLGAPLSPLMVWLFLPGAAGVSLSASVDVLRKCKSSQLLDGKAPSPSVLTVILGGLAVGIPGAYGWWLWRGLTWPPIISLTMMAVFSAIMDYGLYLLGGRLLRRMG
jgi:hypothetical protein